jgi:hypothetical protein
MPEEAQQPEPTQRRTAMQAATEAAQVAESAMNLAQSVDDSVASLSEKVTDLSMRLGERALETATVDLSGLATIESLEELRGHVSGVRSGAPTFDQLDARIADALAPLQADIQAQRGNLTSSREETGGYMGAVNRKLDDLRTRMAELEKFTPDGESMTAAAEELGGTVRRELDGILARLEELERRPTGSNAPELTWDAIAERVTNQAKIEVQKHLALIAPGGVAGASPVKPRGVQAKVLELMRSVDSIGKDRQAEKSAGGYRFRGIDEAMDTVGHAMRSIGLIGAPEIRSVEYDTNYSNNSQGRSILWTTARVVGAYVFTDPEDGSTHRIELVGEGRDNSDKATSKASSMALKYGLLHGLMIPVNGMPDGDAENPEVGRDPREDTAAEPQQARQRPPAQPPNPQPPAQQATPQERAQRAVAAFQALDRLQGQERYNRFVAMNNHARNEGLINIEVEWKGQRAPLHYFVSAVELLLFPKQQDNVPPPADEPPPWEG